MTTPHTKIEGVSREMRLFNHVLDGADALLNGQCDNWPLDQVIWKLEQSAYHDTADLLRVCHQRLTNEKG